MDHCVFHPNLAAVERCEICNRALCERCLWYADDGRRLCATHAREVESAGMTVLPPETYAEAIGAGRPLLSTERGQGSLPDGSGPARSYLTNNNDLLAMGTALVAGVTLVSCFGGVYCLPFVAILAGIAAYINASAAANPERTRLFAAVGIGLSAFMLLLLFAFIAFYVVLFTFVLLAAP
jgi:hypothetical protein